MEVSAEAKRIMVVALGKLYGSRAQRGGLRLHRSLLLTLVMKSARDMYHAAQATTDRVAAGCEHEEEPTAERNTESPGVQIQLQGPASLDTGKPRTLPGEEVVVSRSELRGDAEDKENLCPTGPAQHSRKRRGKADVEPDFLPCKKAKLQVHSVLLDYVNCSSQLGASPPPMSLQRAVAVC